MSKKKQRSSPTISKKDGLPVQLIIALITASGLIITAIISYFSSLRTVDRIIEATQTAEAKLSVSTSIATPTLFISTSTRITSVTQIASSTATPLATATIDLYKPRGECDIEGKNVFPCFYLVRGGEGPIMIAKKIYKDPNLVYLILEFNRKSDGNYLEQLKIGTQLFLPDPDVPPSLPYPICVKLSDAPCQYRALQGETYQDIAQNFYKNVALADVIRKTNKEYDPGTDDLRYKIILDKTILILPPLP